ncbi:perlucin-like [Ostrea edulis]|uniref:perlucin-like n=1 Tax=Ostrea edulis TaxID=37623 RepID=UPI0024AF1B7B|nr:perlucin-like [Ostrea edulis]
MPFIYLKDFCTSRGSYLIEMNSHHENRWVTESFLLPVTGVEVQCPNPWSCSYWIGASFRASSGKFEWNYSGGDMTFPEWSSGQPNNSTGSQDCVSLGRDGQANDQHCGIPFQFVCEKGGTNGPI